MNRWILTVAVVLLLAGCTQEQMKQQMEDPNSALQKVAETIPKVTGPAAAVVKAVPGIPFAPVILGILTLLGGAATTVQSWRKGQTQSKLEEVVAGNEAFKKVTNDSAAKAFKSAQANAQSIATTKEVSRIRDAID